ncbi:hypothetical protein CB1_001441011 [Camelus ferus]|nr:hypothetical protein CB1_001441011 [Camelus ferus]
MGSKDLAVIILLIISGELYAEALGPPRASPEAVRYQRLAASAAHILAGAGLADSSSHERVSCCSVVWLEPWGIRRDFSMVPGPGGASEQLWSEALSSLLALEPVHLLPHPGAPPSNHSQEKPCGFPSVENGRIAQYYYTFERYYFPMSVNQNLTFSCLAGHTTKTGKREARTTCTAAGWYPEPRCFRRRSRCPPPPLPANSNVQTHSATYRHGAAVRLSCELHFEMQGPEEMRCENGKWTEPPKCVEAGERVACGEPPFVENAAAQPSSGGFHSGDKVTYACAPGYHLRGPPEIACRGGQWTAPPACAEPCTVNVDDMRRSNLEMKWQYEGKILHGDLIDFVCKQGYDLPPPTPLSELSVQCDRGRVKYPLCVRKESERTCASPPLIKNGVIKGSTAGTYENGSSVEYRCFEHYFLQGSREAYCSEGAWTAPPLCLGGCLLTVILLNYRCGSTLHSDTKSTATVEQQPHTSPRSDSKGAISLVNQLH